MNDEKFLAYVREQIAENPRLSDAQIASLLRLSTKTVRFIRAEMAGQGNPAHATV